MVWRKLLIICFYFHVQKITHHHQRSKGYVKKKYLRKYLKNPSDDIIKLRSYYLPELEGKINHLDPNKKTLIFDLDETLIHSVSLKDVFIPKEILQCYHKIQTHIRTAHNGAHRSTENNNKRIPS